MFTEWMEIYKTNPEAKKLTDALFPTRFVLNPSTNIWMPQQKGINIGMVVNIHPSAGEFYYLRILLNYVRGPTSYATIRTMGDKEYAIFKESRYAIGLLNKDKE